MIQHMLAIWSLVPLPFLKPACTSESSRFVYCWSLVWKILSITLLAWMFKLSHYTRNSLKTFISRITYLFVFCENCICILQWRIKIYQNFIGFENFTLLANYMHTFFCFDIIWDCFQKYYNICTTIYMVHGEGSGTPLQYSCLENPMDRGAW